MTNQKELPWAFLDAWRGKSFTGEWPTIPEMFRITVERYSDRNCFTVFEPDRNTLTYKQVLANVEKLSYWLYEQGIRAGDRVAVTGKNTPEWATVFLATHFCGADDVPIDHGLHEHAKTVLLP